MRRGEEPRLSGAREKEKKKKRKRYTFVSRTEKLRYKTGNRADLIRTGKIEDWLGKGAINRRCSRVSIFR